ncbi:hypothetical protein [Novosphingobium rosa]|uniref:hypothetical protein n=1 Tax=Novosphingobium rosa TaxID=76978 RepID=UPI0008356E5D|nr:hypothetical protein [Novosphingobium rosa]
MAQNITTFFRKEEFEHEGVTYTIFGYRDPVNSNYAKVEVRRGSDPVPIFTGLEWVTPIYSVDVQILFDAERMGEINLINNLFSVAAGDVRASY